MEPRFQRSLFPEVLALAQRIAIVGSRAYPEPSAVQRFVSELPAGTVVVSGGASGVDTWAEEAAYDRDLQTVVFPADWERHGRAAGPIRNAQVVDFADEVVAFWDGASRGTLNTVVQAVRKGNIVRVIGPDGRDIPLDEVVAAAERLGVVAAVNTTDVRPSPPTSCEMCGQSD